MNKVNISKVFKKVFVKTPIVLMTFVIGVFVTVLGSFGFSDFPIAKEISLAFGVTLMVSGCGGLLHAIVSEGIHNGDMNYLFNMLRGGIVGVYDSTKSSKYKKEVLGLVPTATHIEIYGIGIGVFWDDDDYELLEDAILREKTNVYLTLASANESLPVDCGLNLRIEEELKDKSHTSRRGSRMKMLEKIRELEDSNAKLPNFKIAIFEHYPTLSVIRIDDHFFVFNYGFQTAGTTSPVLHIHGTHSAAAKYYEKQLMKIRDEYFSDSKK